MNLRTLATITLAISLAGCVSYNAYEKGRTAEKTKNWDEAVVQYQKALDIDPDNMHYQMNLQRAKLEASRIHFEKGKTLRAAASTSRGEELMRLAQLAAGELELTVKLDPTNQYAAVEYGKVVAMINEAQRIDDRNNEILRALRGDTLLRARNENTPPAISDRVFSIIGDQSASLSRPTRTQDEQYRFAAQDFEGVLAQLRQLIEVDLKSLEKQMEAAGAPWTPGRLPDWKELGRP